MSDLEVPVQEQLLEREQLALRRNEVRARIIEAYARSLLVLDPSGAFLDALADDPVEAGELAAETTVNVAALWRDHLGPMFNSEGVRHLLSTGKESISRQAVSQRRSLLALRTASGQVVYPAFQFQGRNLVDGLGEVLGVLSEKLVSRWTVASWLVSPNVELENETPIRLLSDGYKQPVLSAARRWASALAS